ncbi:MAG: hypothetical protein NTY75_02125 [Candidatus Shapirobacteria bacterium]|nr:hypothetical protein [Candidatus Shapirobacteria bacterium]
MSGGHQKRSVGGAFGKNGKERFRGGSIHQSNGGNGEFQTRGQLNRTGSSAGLGMRTRSQEQEVNDEESIRSHRSVTEVIRERKENEKIERNNEAYRLFHQEYNNLPGYLQEQVRARLDKIGQGDQPTRPINEPVKPRQEARPREDELVVFTMREFGGVDYTKLTESGKSFVLQRWQLLKNRSGGV